MQRVIAFIRHVEPSTTGIKMESSDQRVFQLVNQAAWRSILKLRKHSYGFFDKIPGLILSAIKKSKLNFIDQKP